MSNWYSINNSVKNKLSISIDEEIGGWGITAKDFIDEVQRSGESEIELTISSGGGSVIDALTMYDFLKNSPIKVSVKIIGLAASAATIIALAADDKPVMTENSFFMIHNPWQGVDIWKGMDAEEMRGLADDLIKQAEVMEKFTTKLVNIYIKASGLSDSKVRELMDADTWMTAEEARDFGFVSNEIEGAMKIAAFASVESLEKKGYRNIPKNYVNQLNTVNMSEKKDSILDQIKALLGGDAKAEAPVEAKKDAIDIEALKAEIVASMEAKASVELEQANARVKELEEADAKKVIEAKASAEALEAKNKELEKISASREEIPAKEDNPSGKKNEIKDELGEAILATFEKSGLRNKK